MIKDFRAISFESIFNSDINFEHTEVVKNKLEDNQLLRCNQLLENTKLNNERIINSIETYSNNWSYARIGKVEKCTLILGISELIMNLTPKKVVISEWVKLTDKHSSQSGAKFVNGILNAVSNENGIYGYRVAPGTDAKAFETLGFQSGDIVTAVNGLDLGDPANTISLYQTMRDATEATFDIQRGESSLTLSVSLGQLQ